MLVMMRQKSKSCANLPVRHENCSKFSVVNLTASFRNSMSLLKEILSANHFHLSVMQISIGWGVDDFNWIFKADSFSGRFLFGVINPFLKAINYLFNTEQLYENSNNSS